MTTPATLADLIAPLNLASTEGRASAEALLHGRSLPPPLQSHLRRTIFSNYMARHRLAGSLDALAREMMELAVQVRSGAKLAQLDISAPVAVAHAEELGEAKSQQRLLDILLDLADPSP